MVQQATNQSGAPLDDMTSPEVGHIIGVDIGGSNLRLALADLQGSIQARWATSTAGIRAPDLIVDRICDGVAALEERTARPRASLRSVGVGAPGVTDFTRGVVLATSYLMGWRDVPLRDLLSSRLGVPAVVDNDVNLAALGESWAGAGRGIQDYVFVAIGTGVGAGIVLKGEVFRGERWHAGEIGYMLVPGTSDTPVEEGMPGALEGLVGGEGLKTQWRLLQSGGQSSFAPDLNATQIFDLAVAGEPTARSVLERAGRTLAYAIQNIGFILNCRLVVLGGGVGVHPALAEAVRTVLLQQGSRAAPTVVTSELGPEAQIFGAIHLALAAAQISHAEAQ